MAKVCVEFDAGDNGSEPSPGVKTYVQTVGDGTALSYTVRHGLGSRDVFYVLRDSNSGVLDGSDVSLTAVNENDIRLDFVTAPASNSVSVMLLAAPRPE